MGLEEPSLSDQAARSTLDFTTSINKDIGYRVSSIEYGRTYIILLLLILEKPVNLYVELRVLELQVIGLLLQLLDVLL